MALRVLPNDYQPPQPPTEEAPEELPIEETTEDPMAAMPAEGMGGGNVDPMVARYLGPESRCQGCIHYLDPGQCEIVAGQIDPQGVCSLFTADAEATSLTQDNATDVATEPANGTPPEIPGTA